MDPELAREQALEYDRWKDDHAKALLMAERIRELEEQLLATETELQVMRDKVEVLRTVVDAYEQGREVSRPDNTGKKA